MSDNLTCKEVARLISAGLDAELPEPQRERVRLHFALCQACRTVDAQIQFLRNALRALARDPPQD